MQQRVRRFAAVIAANNQIRDAAVPGSRVHHHLEVVVAVLDDEYRLDLSDAVPRQRRQGHSDSKLINSMLPAIGNATARSGISTELRFSTLILYPRTVPAIECGRWPEPAGQGRTSAPIIEFHA